MKDGSTRKKDVIARDLALTAEPDIELDANRIVIPYLDVAIEQTFVKDSAEDHLSICLIACQTCPWRRLAKDLPPAYFLRSTRWNCRLLPVDNAVLGKQTLGSNCFNL